MSDEHSPPANDSSNPSDNDLSVDPDSVEGLFLRALQQQDLAAREALVAAACGNDQERHDRVLALLKAFEDAGSFLETPSGNVRGADEVSLSFLAPTDKAGLLGTIGPYEVVEVIGWGGMGIVLRAFEPVLERVVAIKVLMPGLAANVNARRRFLREARAAAAVSDPHVVTIHAVEESTASNSDSSIPPYLVMECVIGQSLQEKLDDRGALPLPETLRISCQVARGLAAAHKQGLVHRDIKPANILLENGVERVKITDFGLARAIDDISVTRTGELSGTPQYMSPEQASGQLVDHRSDLFSLGCVMYAMCTGHSPFRARSIVHAIKRVTEDTPRPIHEQNPDVPTWMAEIIDCLLSKKPDDRFQSSGELAKLLEQHLAHGQQIGSSASHSQINRRSPAISPSPAATRGPQHQAVTDADDESVLGKVGGFVILTGIFVLLVPVAMTAYGLALRDGNALDLGLTYLPMSCLMGCLMAALGYVLRYVLDLAPERHRRLRYWIPVLLAMMSATGAVITTSPAEKAPLGPALIQHGFPPDAPVIKFKYPPMRVRDVFVNGAPLPNSHGSNWIAVSLSNKLLGARVNLHLVAADGREYKQYAFHVNELLNTVHLTESDLAPGDRVLVEIADDVPEVELRAVSFPIEGDEKLPFTLFEAPFQRMLPPGEHELRLQYIPVSRIAYSKLDDFLDLNCTVTIDGPTQLSLRSLLDEAVR